MDACTRVIYISSIACSLFQCLPEEDLDILAAELTQLGDTLATMLAIGICEQNTELPNEVPAQL